MHTEAMTTPWHGGAAAVATLTFDVDAETPILAAGRRYADHLMTMSHQSYGPDVGVPRILDMLDDLGVPATFFIPGWVAEHRPGWRARSSTGATRWRTIRTATARR